MLTAIWSSFRLGLGLSCWLGLCLCHRGYWCGVLWLSLDGCDCLWPGWLDNLLLFKLLLEFLLVLLHLLDQASLTVEPRMTLPHAACEYDSWLRHTILHLRYLFLVLDMVVPVIVQVLLIQNCLLIKQSLGECVVLSLNPLRLPLSDEHVQTHRSWLRACLDTLVPLGHSAWSSYDTRPLSRWDFNKLVQQNLVVFVDCQIFLIGKELLCLSTVLPVLLNLIGYLLCLLLGLVSGSNLVHFSLMNL